MTGRAQAERKEQNAYHLLFFHISAIELVRVLNIELLHTFA